MIVDSRDIGWLNGEYPEPWEASIERNAKAALEEIRRMADEATPCVNKYAVKSTSFDALRAELYNRQFNAVLNLGKLFNTEYEEYSPPKDWSF